jgi:cyclic beta-1,2-glucan synthetase
MLTSAAGIEDLVEALEVRFLANRDPNLYFALLTDFGDAAQESLVADAPLLALAEARIRRTEREIWRRCWESGPTVNPKKPPFSSSSIALGAGTRRGRLDGLRAQARQAGRPECAVARWRARTLQRWSSVIAFRAVVRRQIRHHAGHRYPAAARCRASVCRRHGASAEPPAFTTRKQRVTEGYGILQPRVAVSLPGTNRSRYARLYGGEPGIDPYTACGFGCLSGCLWRRLVHRQGHLRR